MAGVAVLCWFIGHKWYWYLAKGDHGEPGMDKCMRCDAEKERFDLPCRCLIECACYPAIFVFEE